MAPTTMLPFRPNLHRHDTEPTPEPTPAQVPPTPAPKPVDPAPTPATVDPKPTPPPTPEVGDGGKKAIAAEREAAKAAKAAAAAAETELAAARKVIAGFEDATRTELEKAQAAATRALEQVATANRRAVTSELRSAAIGAEALDPTDIVDFLERRADDFIKDGVIDTAAIETEVAGLLEKKPHWKKPAVTAPVVPEKKPAPKPDPSQGPRGTSTTPDFTDPKVYAAESARLGLRTYDR